MKLRSLQKNLNRYWAFASSLCLWFLFFHSPPVIIEREMYLDAPIATHLAGSYAIYLACLFNTLITPSTAYGKYHTIIGKVGMLAGFASFILGFYCTWLRGAELDDGFRIGITIGGLSQVAGQIIGWRSIRQYKEICCQMKKLKKATSQDNDETLAEMEELKQSALKDHVYNMTGLYTSACGSPAMIRLVGIIHPDASTFVLAGSVIGLSMIAKLFGDTYFQQTERKVE